MFNDERCSKFTYEYWDILGSEQQSSPGLPYHSSVSPLSPQSCAHDSRSMSLRESLKSSCQDGPGRQDCRCACMGRFMQVKLVLCIFSRALNGTLLECEDYHVVLLIDMTGFGGILPHRPLRRMAFREFGKGKKISATMLKNCHPISPTYPYSAVLSIPKKSPLISWLMALHHKRPRVHHSIGRRTPENRLIW